MKIEEWLEHDLHVVLKAPKNVSAPFQCPRGVADWLHLNYVNKSSKYKVGKGGRLYGENSMWNSSQFCAAYADVVIEYADSEDEYDDYVTDGAMELTFATCIPEEEKEDSLFHPIALAISIFFLLLTLVLYFWSDNMNIKELHSRITVIFIANLILAYTVSMVIWLLDRGDHRQIIGTLPCKLVGYCQQYFYLR